MSRQQLILNRQYGMAAIGIGAIGCILSMILWIIRPKQLMKWSSIYCCRRHRRHHKQLSTLIDRERTEIVMRSIRGIPFLIQVCV